MRLWTNHSRSRIMAVSLRAAATTPNPHTFERKYYTMRTANDYQTASDDLVFRMEWTMAPTLIVRIVKLLMTGIHILELVWFSS